MLILAKIPVTMMRIYLLIAMIIIITVHYTITSIFDSNTIDLIKNDISYAIQPWHVSLLRPKNNMQLVNKGNQN